VNESSRRRATQQALNKNDHIVVADGDESASAILSPAVVGQSPLLKSLKSQSSNELVAGGQ